MLFTDSSNTLKTTVATLPKAYYINENKVSSIEKMKHILYLVLIGVP